MSGALKLMSERRINSVRERIVDEHEELLHHESLKGVLLATGIVLATFGTAAVLMPEGVTGDFSESYEIEGFQIQEATIRNVAVDDSRLSFVQDYEVLNPNYLPAEFDAISYRITVDGEDVKSDYIEADKVIDAGQTDFVAFFHETDIPESNGISVVTVEGKMVFDIGGQSFDRNYMHTFPAMEG